MIKQIHEHAKKYDSAVDKKNFLKNVSGYEQKDIEKIANKIINTEQIEDAKTI